MNPVFLVELTVVFAAPQLLGLAVICGARRGSPARAVLAPFAAVATYLTASWMFWSAEARHIAAATGRPPCGAFGAVSVYAIVGGALVQFAVASLVVGAWLIFRRLARDRSPIAA